MILLVMTEQARAILANILVNGIIDGFTVRAERDTIGEARVNREVILHFRQGLYNFRKRIHIAFLESFEDPAGYVELVREEFWIARNRVLFENTDKETEIKL